MFFIVYLYLINCSLKFYNIMFYSRFVKFMNFLHRYQLKSSIKKLKMSLYSEVPWGVRFLQKLTDKCCPRLHFNREKWYVLFFSIELKYFFLLCSKYKLLFQLSSKCGVFNLYRLYVLSFIKKAHFSCESSVTQELQ